MYKATLIDENNGIEYSIEEPRWCSDHKNPLSVSEIKGICSDQIDLKERSIWRYKEAFPIDISTKVSLGEGCTPLVSGSFRGYDVLFKLEWFGYFFKVSVNS